MVLLKQSTAATLRVGPFMDATDAVTPETGITLGAADQAEALKATGGVVDISGATWAAITSAGGWYDLSLTTSHTDTLGMLTVIVQDTSVCLPVFVRAMVVPANVWDSLVGGSDTLDANVLEWSGTAVPTTEAGGPGVIRRSTAQGATASTITLDASASAVDDFYNGCFVEVISGTGLAQGRTVADYNGTTKVVTVDRDWATTPSTDIFRIFAGSLGPTVTEINAAVESGQVGTDVAAILVDTGTTLDAALAVVDANVDAILVDTGTTLDTVVDAIKVKTDQLTFTKANEVDSNTKSLNGTTLAGDGSGTPWGP